MEAALIDYLRERTASKYQAFMRQTEGLTTEQALRFSRPDWPDHRWGLGQNGSIAGIVYHVAAWKQLTLPALLGGTPLSRDQFDPASYPELTDWPATLAWYRRIGTEWNAYVASLPSNRFAMTISWEGNSISIAKLVMEIIDHDIHHASQIEYLRQLLWMEA